MAETCAVSKEEEKPTSRLAVAELEAALSASLFLTSPSGNDDEGVLGTEVIVHSENQIVKSPNHSPTRSTDRKRHVRRLSREAMSQKSLIDCGSVSSGENSGEQSTLIANIGDVTFTSYDSARSVGSRRSRKSRRSRCISVRSRKRGNSLERDVSLAILQTAAGGAESAHFLVTHEQKSPIKSAEDILSDLFVSQDTSLETFSHDETDGNAEFPNAFFVEATTEISSEVVCAEPSPSAPEDEDTSMSPTFARTYRDWKTETTVGPGTTAISETFTEDSLFTFSDVVQEPKRGDEPLYPEDVLARIETRCLPNDSPKATPPTSTKEAEGSTLEANSVLTDNAIVSSPERYAQESPSVNRYSTEAGSGNAAGFQYALSFVSSSTAEMDILSVALNPSIIEKVGTTTKKILSSSILGKGDLSVEREQIFLDKLVNIVAKAQKERLDVDISHYYESEGDHESNCTEEDETSRSQSGAEDDTFSSVARVESQESATDPDLDAFLHTRGFADPNDGDGEEEWMAFDTSPFTNFDNMTEISGSTASAPRGDEPSPDSPTSITDFSSSSSIREATKKIRRGCDTTTDDIVSL